MDTEPTNRPAEPADLTAKEGRKGEQIPPEIPPEDIAAAAPETDETSIPGEAPEGEITDEERLAREALGTGEYSFGSRPPEHLTAKEKKKKKLIKIFLYVLCIAVMGGVIAYTAVSDFSRETVDLSSVFGMIGRRWYYLLVLAGLFFGMMVAESVKIFIMIHKTSGKLMPLAAFSCAALGKFYDYVTPLGSGGQPFQIYYLAKHGVPTGPAGAIPIGSFFLSQFSLFLLSVASFIIGVNASLVPVYIQILAYIGSVFTVSVSLFLVVFSFLPKAGCAVIDFGVKVLTMLKICKTPEKWKEKGRHAIYNNKKNMSILFKSKRVLIVCSLLSVLYMLMQGSMPYFTLLLFSDLVGFAPSWENWFEITRVTYFIYCAVSFIPTPGNSGAADGTFYGLFRSVLTAAGTCFTGMMIWRVFSFYSFLILGIAVLIAGKTCDHVRKRRRAHIPA